MAITLTPVMRIAPVQFSSRPPENLADAQRRIHENLTRISALPQNKRHHTWHLHGRRRVELTVRQGVSKIYELRVIRKSDGYILESYVITPNYIGAKIEPEARAVSDAPQILMRSQRVLMLLESI